MTAENPQHRPDSLVKKVYVANSRVGSLALAGVAVASKVEGWWSGPWQAGAGIASGLLLASGVAVAVHGGDESAKRWRKVGKHIYADEEVGKQITAYYMDRPGPPLKELEVEDTEIQQPLEQAPMYVDIPAQIG